MYYKNKKLAKYAILNINNFNYQKNNCRFTENEIELDKKHALINR